MSLFDRVRALLSREAVRRETSEEMQFHIDMAAKRFQSQGLSAEAAEARARATFGGQLFHAEAAVEALGGTRRERILQDLRFLGRTLHRRPMFAAAVLGTLSVGIAASTAIFSVVNGVLLRPLPFPHAERLAYIGWSYRQAIVARSLSPYQLEFIRQHARAFDGVTTYRSVTRALGSDEDARPVRGLRVTEDFFRVIGVTPVMGRTFAPNDGGEGAAPVVILGHTLWQQAFQGDAGVIGRTVSLAGKPTTIIGVMPERFQFPAAPENIEALFPLTLTPDPKDEGANWEALARVKAGWSTQQLQQDFDGVARAMKAEQPQLFEATTTGIKLLSFQDLYAGELRTTLWVLLGAVLCVVLIATSNAANLLLVRSASREREMLVRIAIGAPKRRVVSQLMTEGIGLAAIAAVIGVVLGSWGLRVMLAMMPSQLPRVAEIGMDWRVTLFVVGLTLLTGVVFGMAAAMPTRRANIASGLRGGRSAVAVSRVAHDSMVAVQVAFAVVLLTGSALFLTSLARLRAVEPGFNPEGVVAFRFERELARMGDPAAFERELTQRARTIPGVQSVALSVALPLERGLNLPVSPSQDAEKVESAAEWRAVSEHYFDALGIKLLKGRAFGDVDAPGAPAAAIINKTMAQRFFGAEDPIGRYVDIARWRGEWLVKGAQPAVIVGIADDTKDYGLGSTARPTVYVPIGQMPKEFSSPIRIVARAARTNDAMRALPLELAQMLPGERLPAAERLSDALAKSLAEPRFQAMLFAVFAATALVLTAVGIFSVISYLVATRVREIGIRTALGATPSALVRSVISRNALFIGTGAAVGSAIVLVVGKFAEPMLYGTAPRDPVLIATSVGLLLIVGLLASFVPARRAAKVNPAIAFRAD